MIISSIVFNNNKTYVIKLIKLLGLLKTHSYKSTGKSKKFKIKQHKLDQNLISYVINVVLSPTNTFINVVDLKGNVLVSISAGSLNLTKFQKKAQPMALLILFKELFNKAGYLKDVPVALHFKNVRRFHESFFINILKTKLYIKSFQSYNLTPHNGCRPKKIKKIKVRTKRLILR